MTFTPPALVHMSPLYCMFYKHPDWMLTGMSHMALVTFLNKNIYSIAFKGQRSQIKKQKESP